MSRIPTQLAMLTLAAGLGACSALQGSPALDRTFGGQVAILQNADTGNPIPAIGRIPKNLETAELDATDENFSRFAATERPMVSHSLHFESLVGDRVCFMDIDTDVTVPESAEERLAHYAIWIEALDGLDAIAKRPLRPSPGARLDSGEVISDETGYKVTEPHVIARTITWRLCGPAPKISPRTRYLAAVVHLAGPLTETVVDWNHPDSTEDDKQISDTDPRRDGLLLWELADGPRPK